MPYFLYPRLRRNCVLICVFFKKPLSVAALAASAQPTTDGRSGKSERGPLILLANHREEKWRRQELLGVSIAFGRVDSCGQKDIDTANCKKKLCVFSSRHYTSTDVTDVLLQTGHLPYL